ncbi:hypothetical protein [Acaryochloris marina]|uniref:hypothetical protein n=1 Tax=Acaryochloris marina TaxID=155978 RepID=UPI001EE66336|nr:hypothetical protein [Acaryochloris marina]
MSATLQLGLDVDLLRAILVEKTKPSTREGYTKDLVDFFLFVTQGEMVYGVEGPKRKSEIKAQVKRELSRLSQSFVGIGRLKALELAARYRECMMQRGLQANTINRRLSAVKSMVRMARRLEMCDWTLAEVDGLTVKPYRDTRGITASKFRLMMVIGCQPHRRCRDNHKADQPPNLNRIIWRTLPLR